MSSPKGTPQRLSRVDRRRDRLGLGRSPYCAICTAEDAQWFSWIDWRPLCRACWQDEFAKRQRDMASPQVAGRLPVVQVASLFVVVDEPVAGSWVARYRMVEDT